MARWECVCRGEQKTEEIRAKKKNQRRRSCQKHIELGSLVSPGGLPLHYTEAIEISL